MTSVHLCGATAQRWALLAILLPSVGLLGAACGGGGSSTPTSPPATPAPVTPPAPPPAPEPPQLPEGTTIAAYGSNFIEWSWNPIDGASGYEVQFRADAAPTDDEDTITLAANETSYRAENIETETDYFFRVRAFTGEGGSRIPSTWSAVESGQIGRFGELFNPFIWIDEDDVQAILEQYSLPPDEAARLEALGQYGGVTAHTDRGLPTGPYAFGCRTVESLRSQTQEWVNGFAFFFSSSTLPSVDAWITQAESIVDSTLDGFAARLREDKCRVFYPDETHVWNGEADELLIRSEPALPGEEAEEISVIRVLATAANRDPAPRSTEAEFWWIWSDLSSAGPKGDTPVVPPTAPPPPPPPTLPDDHGDHETTATLVSVPSTTQGSLDYLGDVDYFRFQLNSDVGRLVVETTGEADTFGTLFGPDSEPMVDHNSGEALNFKIEVTDAPAGTYHLAIENGSLSAETEYELRISSAPQN